MKAAEGANNAVQRPPDRRRSDVCSGSRLCENPIEAMIPLLNRGGMMKGFVQGADRQQTTLLPECVDDWVDESNPVRAVDVFVDALELRDLGFGAGAKGGLTACVAAELARPLRPGSRGEGIGSFDGLAALLASRWSHFCFDGVAFGLAARVGPAVALALLDGLAGVARPAHQRAAVGQHLPAADLAADIHLVHEPFSLTADAHVS
jgi:hypothetical protein